MINYQYALATPTCEFLQPADSYSEALRRMHMGDCLYQRTLTTVEYHGGGSVIVGAWIPIPVPGISHCAVCPAVEDLAPGWDFNKYHLYCVDHWCEITEHTEAEIRYQQIHQNDVRPAA